MIFLLLLIEILCKYPLIQHSILPKNAVLQVRRSFCDSSFENAFKGAQGERINRLLLDFDVSATVKLLAYHNKDSQTPLSGGKLTNILETYTSFIPRNRWASQLPSSVSESNNSVQNQISNNAQRGTIIDEQSLRVGTLIGTAEGAARAHSFLRRSGSQALYTDAQIIQQFQDKPDAGIRNLPRRRRAPQSHLSRSKSIHVSRLTTVVHCHSLISCNGHSWLRNGKCIRRLYCILFLPLQHARKRRHKV